MGFTVSTDSDESGPLGKFLREFSTNRFDWETLVLSNDSRTCITLESFLSQESRALKTPIDMGTRSLCWAGSRIRMWSWAPAAFECGWREDHARRVYLWGDGCERLSVLFGVCSAAGWVSIATGAVTLAVPSNRISATSAPGVE